MPVFDAAAAAAIAGASAPTLRFPTSVAAPSSSPRLRAARVPSCALLLAGCTWYHREPLAPQDTSTSARSLERVRIDASTMPLPELAAHRFDPSDGFDIDEVAMLAVANNPDLKLARDDLGIARAQAYSAGLLPDPQLSVSSDYPGAIGTTRAFSYGLSMDVMAIVLRSANRQSADAARRQERISACSGRNGRSSRRRGSCSSRHASSGTPCPCCNSNATSRAHATNGWPRHAATAT